MSSSFNLITYVWFDLSNSWSSKARCDLLYLWYGIGLLRGCIWRISCLFFFPSFIIGLNIHCRGTLEKSLYNTLSDRLFFFFYCFPGVLSSLFFQKPETFGNGLFVTGSRLLVSFLTSVCLLWNWNVNLIFTKSWNSSLD